MGQSKKIVLLGQFGVGKTSLVRRFLSNKFSKDYKTTLGVQIKKKEISLPSGKTLSMIIWDLEGFSSVSRTRASYLLGSHGFIYVFDLTRPATYYNLDEEIDFLQKKYPSVVTKVVGNKSDINDPKTIKEYFDKKNIDVDCYVSAKSGEGVESMFINVANTIHSYG